MFILLFFTLSYFVSNGFVTDFFNECINFPGIQPSILFHNPKLPGPDKGTYKIKNQAELQVHHMLLENRKRQFQSKFKAIGNNVRNAQRLVGQLPYCSLF